MKRQFVVLLMFIMVGRANAQPVRIHLLGGFSNYSGDIQQKRFTLSQANPVVSGGGTINITSQFAIRGDASFTKLGADDKKNANSTLRARNLNFKTLIEELTLMGEYDILNLQEHKLSPYVFAGIGLYHFSPYTTDSAGRKVYLVGLHTEGEGFPEYPDRKVYKTKQLNIPFGGGVKYALSPDVFIAFEMGIRKLFTDYLDDVSTTYVDRNLLLNRAGPEAVSVAFRGDELKPSLNYPAAGTQRGNSKSKDYYYYGEFRISFRMPWFDNGGSEGSKSNKKSLSCPLLMR